MTPQQKLALIVLSLFKSDIPNKQPAFFSRILKKALIEDKVLFLEAMDSFYTKQKPDNLINTRSMIQILFTINTLLSTTALKETCLRFMNKWIAELEAITDNTMVDESKLSEVNTSWRAGEATLFPLNVWNQFYAFYYRLLTDKDISDDFKAIFQDVVCLKYFAIYMNCDFDLTKKLSVENLSTIYQNISNIPRICGYSYFVAIRPQKRNELVEHSEAYLAITRHIPLSDFLNLADLKRQLLIQYYDSLCLLLNNNVFFPNEFLNYSPEISEKLLQKPAQVIILKRAGIPIKILFSRLAHLREEFFAKAEKVSELYASGITCDYLSFLTTELRNEFYEKAEVIAFLCKAEIPITLITRLTLEQRTELYENAQAIVLLYKAGLSLNILSLPKVIKEELIKNAKPISFLIEHTDFPLSHLLRYTIKERSIIYSYYDTLTNLIKYNLINLNTFIHYPERLEKTTPTSQPSMATPPPLPLTQQEKETYRSQFITKCKTVVSNFSNANALASIIKTKLISLGEFLSLDQITKTMLLNNLDSTLILMAQNQSHPFSIAINAVKKADSTLDLFRCSLTLQVTLLKYHTNAALLLQKYRAEAKASTPGLYDTLGFKNLFGKLCRTSANLIFICLEDKEGIINTESSFAKIEEHYRTQALTPQTLGLN